LLSNWGIMFRICVFVIRICFVFRAYDFGFILLAIGAWNF
jgi:hypothetical protein